MLILAIDQSSQNCSLAVLDEEKVIAERKWDAMTLRSSGLFLVMRELLAQNKISFEDISSYVVDVGPGSYGGLRSALAAVRAFALPQKQEIYALTSAEIMAFEIIENISPGLVQVVGDARRGQWWTAIYENCGGLPVARQKIELMPVDKFACHPRALVVSPDWLRIKDNLAAAAKGGQVLEDSCVPTASALGRLARRKMQENIPGEPLAPIYLHAAVAEHKERSRSPE